MPFCTKCGTKIEDGQIHVCYVQNVTPSINQPFVARPQSNVKLNINDIIELIKNPFKSLSLDVEKDFILGVLGIVASAISVFLWMLAEFHVLGGSWMNRSSWDSSDTSGVFAFIATALALTVVQFIVVYIMANWLGAMKYPLKNSITILGATQWLPAIGFLIATLAVFINMKLAVVLFLSVWILTVAIFGLISFKVFDVPQEKQILVIFVTVFICIIITGLVGSKTILSL